jgi:hypothetical protein
MGDAMKALVSRIGTVGLFAAVLFTAAPALADSWGSHHPRRGGGIFDAPEIGAVGGTAVATLLVGGTLLLGARARKSAKKD